MLIAETMPCVIQQLVTTRGKGANRWAPCHPVTNSAVHKAPLLITWPSDLEGTIRARVVRAARGPPTTEIF